VFVESGLECGKQEWVLLPLHRKFARMLKKAASNSSSTTSSTTAGMTTPAGAAA
jgi:hypothetical protein